MAANVLAGRTDLISSLHPTDFHHFFVVLALAGLRASPPGYMINIQRIALRGNQITVWAEIRVLGGVVLGPTSSYPIYYSASPYHLVTVAKDSIGGKQIRFVLMDGLTPVVETDHFIP